MTDDHNPREAIGANNPPADDYVKRLEGDTEDLLDLEADLELALSKVPRDVIDDDGVAAVNTWVVRVRQLARDVEARRVEAKAPYLERERQIDGFFGGVNKRLLARAKDVEGRLTAYLQAKRRREQEEATARAEAAAQERRKQEAAAAEARRVEEAAAAARRRAEDEVAAAARRSAQEAEAAEARLREAARTEAAASKALEEADKGVRTAELAEDRAERRAAAPEKLGRTGGGGANARVVMVPRWRVDSWPKLQQSLGPLGSFFSAEALDKPLGLWAKIAQAKPEERGAIPGVVFYEEPEARTTATRT